MNLFKKTPQQQPSLGEQSEKYRCDIVLEPNWNSFDNSTKTTFGSEQILCDLLSTTIKQKKIDSSINNTDFKTLQLLATQLYTESKITTFVPISENQPKYQGYKSDLFNLIPVYKYTLAVQNQNQMQNMLTGMYFIPINVPLCTADWDDKNDDVSEYYTISVSSKRRDNYIENIGECRVRIFPDISMVLLYTQGGLIKTIGPHIFSLKTIDKEHLKIWIKNSCQQTQLVGGGNKSLAKWQITKENKITLRDGSVRALWRNIKTGELRVKRMLKNRDGNIVATYVKPRV